MKRVFILKDYYERSEGGFRKPYKKLAWDNAVFLSLEVLYHVIPCQEATSSATKELRSGEIKIHTTSINRIPPLIA
jgi:hypothetical protein